MQIKTFEEAIKRIKELEKENSALKEENKKLRSRYFGGRKKHNEAWMASYNDFATKYENGMSIVEIVSEGEISRRTAYRYLAYYRQIMKK
ncbi:MAG: resolvase [Lachnospiraceae bacterium]|nr:resolvase [Lachnospiraceae bacterium]